MHMELACGQAMRQLLTQQSSVHSLTRSRPRAQAFICSAKEAHVKQPSQPLVNRHRALRGLGLGAGISSACLGLLQQGTILQLTLVILPPGKQGLCCKPAGVQGFELSPPSFHDPLPLTLHPLSCLFSPCKSYGPISWPPQPDNLFLRLLTDTSVL